MIYYLLKKHKHIYSLSSDREHGVFNVSCIEDKMQMNEITVYLKHIDSSPEFLRFTNDILLHLVS